MRKMATRLRRVFTNLVAVLDKFGLACTKLDARGWVLAIRYFLHGCYIRLIQYLTTPMSGSVSAPQTISASLNSS